MLAIMIGCERIEKQGAQGLWDMYWYLQCVTVNFFYIQIFDFSTSELEIVGMVILTSWLGEQCFKIVSFENKNSRFKTYMITYICMFQPFMYPKH